MKFLKKPVPKRADPITPWEQEVFTSLYKDIPATELPKGGVAEAINALLFGDQFFIRPGNARLSTNGILAQGGDSAHAATKVGNRITLSSTTVPNGSHMEHGVFVWDSGICDWITNYVSSTEFDVASDQANGGASTGYFRGRINALYWHQKSQKIFMLCGREVYHTDLTFSSMTRIYTGFGDTPFSTESSFAEFDEDVFLFNDRRMYKIDTRLDPIRIFRINCSVVANTINNITTETNYGPTDEETTMNRFGRRYIYTHTWMDGLLTGNRADGTSRIIKESGSNRADESTDYIDYIEMWRPMYWGNDSAYTFGSTYVDLVAKCDVRESTGHYLKSWLRYSDADFSITIGTETRDVHYSAYKKGMNTWEDIAAYMETELKASFPEYEYIQVNFDTDGYLVISSGEPDVDVSAISSPTAPDAGADFTTTGKLDSISYVAVTIWGVLGNRSTPALVNNSTRGQTHFSVYATLTLGPAWRIGGNAVRNNQYFIWLKDVRVAACMKVSYAGVAVTASQGEFSLDDLGSWLYFRTPAGAYSYTQIVKVNSTTSINVADVLPSGSNECAIGASTILTGTRSGNIVTLSNGTISSSDEGKSCYWDSGHVNIIRKYLTSTTFEVDGTGGDGTDRALVIDLIGRNFNDNVTDTDLEARSADFPVLSRFWTGMPSGQLGATVPGFLVTAEIDGTQFHYCNLNAEYRYLAGHHRADYQFEIVKDTIKKLQEMPDQLIIYCSNSTWREQTNSSQVITDERVGEAISILSGLSLVDSYVGIMDKQGVTDFATGKKLVITSEPGIRIFDGARYGPNLLYDEQGRSHINTEFEQFRYEITAYYEPNLYGLLIFATTTTDDLVNESLTRSTKCWRLAIERQQGYSFTEITGADWIFPELQANYLRVITEKGTSITIAFDNEKGLPWLICTRKTPSVESLPVRWTDKYTDTDGTEITWSIKLREHADKDHEFKLRFTEEHLNLRPQDEANKDGSGYDSYGFRDAQIITCKKYINGNSVAESQVDTTEPKATIVHPYQIEDYRIQTEISGTASELRCVGIKNYYDTLRRRIAPEIVIKETDYQSALSSDLSIWLSRQPPKGRNRATGLYADTNPVLDDDFGPDFSGVYRTAWRPDVQGEGLVFNNLNLVNGRTIITGFRYGGGSSSNATSDIYKEIISGGKRLHVYIYADYPPWDRKIKVYDNTNLIWEYDIEISKWYIIKIQSTLVEEIYGSIQLWDEDGLVTSYDIGTFDLPASTSNQVYVGTWNDLVLSMFDFRLYNKKITDEAAEYYQRDVFSHDGASLIPAREYV